jgi:hypothetical protein
VSNPFFAQSCHFEGREIFVSSSTKINDSDNGASREDFSSLEMTDYVGNLDCKIKRNIFLRSRLLPLQGLNDNRYSSIVLRTMLLLRLFQSMFRTFIVCNLRLGQQISTMLLLGLFQSMFRTFIVCNPCPQHNS